MIAIHNSLTGVTFYRTDNSGKIDSIDSNIDSYYQMVEGWESLGNAGAQSMHAQDDEEVD